MSGQFIHFWHSLQNILWNSICWTIIAWPKRFLSEGCSGQASHFEFACQFVCARVSKISGSYRFHWVVYIVHYVLIYQYSILSTVHCLLCTVDVDKLNSLLESGYEVSSVIYCLDIIIDSSVCPLTPLSTGRWGLHSVIHSTLYSVYTLQSLYSVICGDPRYSRLLV